MSIFTWLVFKFPVLLNCLECLGRIAWTWESSCCMYMYLEMFKVDAQKIKGCWLFILRKHKRLLLLLIFMLVMEMLLVNLPYNRLTIWNHTQLDLNCCIPFINKACIHCLVDDFHLYLVLNVVEIANRPFCSQSPLEIICFKALRNSHISIFHLLALAEVLCKRFSSIWDEKKILIWLLTMVSQWGADISWNASSALQVA